MAKAAKTRAPHSVEAGTAFSKVVAFAMGPGLMLAVLIVLGVHLAINDRAGEIGVYTAQQQSAAR